MGTRAPPFAEASVPLSLEMHAQALAGWDGSEQEDLDLWPPGPGQQVILRKGSNDPTRQIHFEWQGMLLNVRVSLYMPTPQALGQAGASLLGRPPRGET